MQMRRGLGAILASLTALLAAPAIGHEAAAPALSVQSLRPGSGANDGLLGRAATTLSPGDWSLGSLLHYARTPLRFSASGVRQTVLGDVTLFEAGALVGLPSQWALGLVVPVALQLRGGGPNLVQLPVLPQAPALGDLRLDLRRQWWSGKAGDGTAAFATVAVWEIPTSDTRNWLGGGDAVSLQALVSGEILTWMYNAGAGFRWTPTQNLIIHPVLPTGALDEKTDVVALRAGSTIDLWLGGGKQVLIDRLVVRGELRALIPALTTIPAGLTVVDLLASAEWRFAPWMRATLAVGGSPTGSAGSAGTRMIAGLKFVPGELPSDGDSDGIDDKLDRCPQQAEDKDGFADSDGCPDLDDDGDGIVDTADKCRLRAEDRDGFEDSDGCPDLDDDGDGVADTRDLCPRKPEDIDGHDDGDGCPDPDDDGDGINDVDDLCPQQSENKNGYEDNDGCPDLKPGEAPPALDAPVAPTPVEAPAVAPAPAPEPEPAPLPSKPGKPAKGTKRAKAAAPKVGPAKVEEPDDGKPRAKVKAIEP